eukprot:CAMPEP_0178402930 /NCGR_PEP_ID=MMETSP0689_2-20121128/17106_1 /TAXON_ID=160604 /ORGANISM="Amphidinium massartii, Strain CS-259" /LENGTH=64 /DNA_ID=CAMNT_0020023867 /DNA_START=104 /DNA_END=295 /DNA_ORIENTATION=+
MTSAAGFAFLLLGSCPLITSASRPSVHSNVVLHQAGKVAEEAQPRAATGMEAQLIDRLRELREN